MPASVKTGLVGFGMSAKVFHAPFLRISSEYDIVAVFERNHADAQTVFPNAHIVRTLEEMLSDDSIELIVITTPNETHFPYAKAALEAGKHVILEKPFTTTSEEAGQLIHLARQQQRILSVYQNRRYASDFLTIKEIVLQKKLLGDVHEFETHYDRYRPDRKPQAWREEARPGSGILYDLGPHLIDQVLYLFGIPKTITADIRHQRPHAKVDDYFDIRLDYGFTRATLKASMLVREPGPRYIIHGILGSFIKYGEDPQEDLLKVGISPDTALWGEELESQYGLLHTGVQDNTLKGNYDSLPGNYGQYYNNLFNTIRFKAPLKEKPEHGFNTVRLIELAIESNQKKCTIDCTGLINMDYPL